MHDAFDVLRNFVTTLVMAWAAFAALRWQQPLIAKGGGAWWTALAGTLAFGQWPLNAWLGSPIGAPIVVALLYLLSLIGLAPDDSVLSAQASEHSRWFRRGLVCAVLGTFAGMAAWAALL
ncbi:MULTISPECIES: hypothetical protein [unclassified Lysobacter]|uniref:hypothetical protein n=1 Tax=unclassified Lysobacter TaxID=2635362 RepID=UPI001C228C91|nr:hypothetical protein [Lysobacter sp. MMG2]MBU8976554.1 hypothetical protein [Lysobacter sp. MMG2]